MFLFANVFFFRVQANIPVEFTPKTVLLNRMNIIRCIFPGIRVQELFWVFFVFFTMLVQISPKKFIDNAIERKKKAFKYFFSEMKFSE